MRLRWLLIAIATLTLAPAVASARPIMRPAPYTADAAIERGVFAGTLVVTFENPSPTPVALPIRVAAGTIHYDGLTIVLSNRWTTRTLRFADDRDRAVVETVRLAPHAVHVERIDLDEHTRDLPPGDYDVAVTWDGQPVTLASPTTFVPYRCGLQVAPPAPPAPSPSKWPYVLGGLAGLALGVAALLAKRAGTAAGRVPCCAP